MESINQIDLDFIVYINQLRRNDQPSFTKEQLFSSNLSLNENREGFIVKTSLASIFFSSSIQAELFQLGHLV